MKEKIELQDITEFLSISRKFISQVNILKKIDIPQEYLGVAEDAINKVSEACNQYNK
ncbi:hypothetical protein IAI10_16415 [Clostridium sp. 19966]|uniref:hypothetical protein n=1 Tax=Clostridium sp. 19966 TaxID=2768166 RepID=UPI0028DE9C3E|nr:hypothetical protein [Clostridium sp. 19966]MDT8718252.1 hypothetical protein [Clostridium sp. 19966]